MPVQNVLDTIRLWQCVSEAISYVAF